MPLKTKPLGNNVLIEVQREYEGVSRAEDDNESLSTGRLIDFHIDMWHLTASAGVRLDPSSADEKFKELRRLKGKLVRWEQYAEGGQTFEEDGKTYALIPWWRLISVTEEHLNV